MNSNHLIQHINDDLTLHLSKLLPHNHSIRKVYEYSVFPAGKLFRPQLVWATAMDFGIPLEKNAPHSYLASLVELHHAYTLIHDDLPCMDNDTMRRGRPCTHIAFGEWKALLVGDGLLNASYYLLSRMPANATKDLLSFIGWCLGPKGLIQGQVLDLSLEMNQSLKHLVETHVGKTSRLIQAAIVGSFILSRSLKNETPSKESNRIFMDLFRLGYNLGLAFQLLDDLLELTEESVGEHEQQVNPYLNYKEQTAIELTKALTQVKTVFAKHELKNLEEVIQNYYLKVKTEIEKKEQTIKTHLDKNACPLDLNPIMAFLNTTNP